MPDSVPYIIQVLITIGIWEFVKWLWKAMMDPSIEWKNQWTCPRCGVKISTTRDEDLDRVVQIHRTMPHDNYKKEI